MKKLLLSGLLIATGFCYVSAQDTVYLKKQGAKKIITDRSPQTLFIELGGAGLFFSANYDRRFKKEIGGWGWRAGLGYSFSNTFKATSIPVGVNYLAGNKSKGRFFEAGLNGTLLLVGAYDQYSYYERYNVGGTYIAPNSSIFIPSATLGYRSQPVNGGFSFRGGFTPFLIEGTAQMGAYISLGYCF